MKKIIIVISLLLTLTILFMGCSGSSKTTGSDSDDVAADITEDDADDNAEDAAEVDTEEEEASEEELSPADNAGSTESAESSEDTEVLSSGNFDAIGDLSEYWNSIYNSNEAVINAYEGMPIMELVTPGLCFITGVQYDILNINNENGRYEGDLLLAGYPAFTEKNGSVITFGYEEIVEEESSWSNSMVGDKMIENGTCDLEKGYYYAESYTDRAGAIINRSMNEFKKRGDDSMCALIIEGRTFDFRGEEDLNTSYIFIRGGKDQYDFAVANTEVGTSFEEIHLEEDMTKEQAIELFQSIGATMEYSGGIVDGVFVLD